MVDGPLGGGRGKGSSTEGRGMGCSRYSRATLSYHERDAGYPPQKPRACSPRPATKRRSPEVIPTTFVKFGSSAWTRTRNQVVNSHLLYQLSY